MQFARDGAGDARIEYAFAYHPDSGQPLVASWTGGDAIWLLCDEAGSIRVAARTNGPNWQVEHYTFDAFGKRLGAHYSTSGSATNAALENLPTVWSGGRYEPMIAQYLTDAGWYSPKSRRLLAPQSTPEGHDRYLFRNGYADIRIRASESGPSNLTRAFGVIQAGLGLAEYVSGAVGGVLFSATIVGGIIGGLVAARGWDDFNSGLQSAITGEQTPTYTQKYASGVATWLGASPSRASKIGAGVDFGSRLINPAAALGALSRGATSTGHTVLAWAGRTGPNVGPIARAMTQTIVTNSAKLGSRASTAVGRWLAPGSTVKRFQYLEGTTDVNPTLITNLRKKGWTVEIVEPGHPEYARMVDELTAGEYLGGTHMRLLQKPGDSIKQVAVLEEFLHGIQGKIASFDDIHPCPRYEIHVKDFMIRHRRSLGLEDGDVSVLEELIQNYVQRSKVDTNGVPLSYPPYRRP